MPRSAYISDGPADRTKEAIMFLKACLFVVICASACYAGTRDPSVPDSKYLEYGSKHECVVPIYGECACGEGETHRFSASAVVISPRWVVTAAHVVNGQKDVKVRVGEREFPMRRVIVNRHYKEENVGTYDIAVCESREDMALDFYPDLYEDRDEEGKVASICGYGAIGTFGTGSSTYDGKRRAGANVVDRLERHVMVCSVKGGRKTNLEFMIAHGDSGGGLFIGQKLAGINSFVSTTDGKPNSDYGDECNHTRISLFVPWIKGCIAGEEPAEEVE